MEILVRRASDKIAVIRAKALGYVAATIQHVNSDPALPNNDKLVKFILHSCSAAKASDDTPDKEHVQQGNDVDRMLEFLKKRGQGRKIYIKLFIILFRF